MVLPNGEVSLNGVQLFPLLVFVDPPHGSALGAGSFFFVEISFFETNGSCAVVPLFDDWNQSVFVNTVGVPISDWEANGSTVWNGSTSIADGGAKEDWALKSLEAWNWS